MGISDDIKPRKFRPLADATSKTKKKAKKEKEELSKDVFSHHHDDDFFANTPISKNGKSKVNDHSDADNGSDNIIKKSYRWLYALIIILVILLLLGLIVWQNLDQVKSYINGSYKKSNDQNLDETLSKTSDSLKNYDTNKSTAESQSTTPPAQTTPQIDKSTIVVSVLNGSGVKSSAKTAADALTAAGFNVAYTGNAKSFNYPKTTVYYKTGKEAEANSVKAALANPAIEISESNSIVGASYTIVVVVGKQ